MATSFIEDMKNTPSEKPFQPTWKELRQARRMLPVPFEIPLTDHGTPLICEEIIRLVPEKRMVVSALWGEKVVIAKLFYEPYEAERHVSREVDGLQELKEANIPSPHLLWQGSAQKNKIQILIFEKLINGYSLDDIWMNRVNTEEVLPLMKAVIIELATHHVLGIVQRDLHLKNFFVTHKQIYTLDAGTLSTTFEILPREESINQLALFFAQLGVGMEAIQDQLFQTYAQSRGWHLKKSDYKLLRQSIAKWNEKRWDRFKKKIFRDSSDFVREKRMTGLAIYNQQYYSKEFAELLKNPDSFFNNALLLKNGRSSTVVKIKLNNRSFVIKRYNIKSIWHGLRRCLRATRASNSWQIAQQLHLFGIPTAKPIGFIEKRFLGFRGKSYFIMEYIEGPHVGEFLTNKVNSEEFVSVAEKVIILLGNLFKLRLTHSDLKMTNILIHQNQPFLIDLDGMVEHRTKLSLKKAYRNSLKRFMRNWEQRPSVKALFEKLF